MTIRLYCELSQHGGAQTMTAEKRFAVNVFHPGKCDNQRLCNWRSISIKECYALQKCSFLFRLPFRRAIKQLWSHAPVFFNPSGKGLMNLFNLINSIHLGYDCCGMSTAISDITLPIMTHACTIFGFSNVLSDLSPRSH